MSRYRLPTRDEIAVFVGWDNPLQTFFVQAYLNYNQENEELVLNLGTLYNLFPDIDKFEVALKENNFHLDTYFYNVLLDDYLDRTDPTPLQQWVNKMFEDLNNK